MAEICGGPQWCLDRRTAIGTGNKYSRFPCYGRKFKLAYAGGAVPRRNGQASEHPLDIKSNRHIFSGIDRFGPPYIIVG